jgi:hypothetical protein
MALKPSYGTSTSITITLNSIATGSARESTAIDNTSNKYIDAHVTVKIAMAAGTPASDKMVNVYAYASEDGTNFGDNATGTDAGITIRSLNNLRLIGSIMTVDSGALTYWSHPMSVARAFGGILPRKWGIVVENRTNITFASSGHAATYTGLYLEDV